MAEYLIEKSIDKELWDNLVEKSNEGTIFSKSDYLSACDVNYERYLIFKGGRICAGFSFVLDEEKINVVLDDLVIYNGIFFIKDDSRKEVSLKNERFEITEFVIDWLSSKYSHIELALSPQFEDIRPFLWHNYHSLNKSEKFTVDVRYTSYLNISDINSSEFLKNPFFKRMNTLRQRNIREGAKSSARFTKEKNIDFIIKSYIELMEIQGETVSCEKSSRMKNLMIKLIEKDQAYMYILKNGQDIPIYATVFAIDSKRAYYLFGAGNNSSNERYKGSFCFYNAFLDLCEKGFSEVDMEGVNSPNRGKFKLSFGGDLSTYFQLYKER